MLAKTAIVYAPTDQDSTKLLVEAIAEHYAIDLIDATQVTDKMLQEYDMIGFASDINRGKFHKSILDYANTHLPENKKVFLISTYGGKASYKSIAKVIEEKNSVILGNFSCKALDSKNLLKYISGKKEKPDSIDLEQAVAFYKELLLWVLAS